MDVERPQQHVPFDAADDDRKHVEDQGQQDQPGVGRGQAGKHGLYMDLRKNIRDQPQADRDFGEGEEFLFQGLQVAGRRSQVEVASRRSQVAGNWLLPLPLATCHLQLSC